MESPNDRVSGGGPRAERLVWILAFVAVVFRFVAPFGFNPTDDGWQLSLARRIASGQVPHADFVSVRPVGSGIMHLIDLVLPGPLVLVSRLIALVEVVAYTLLLAGLTFRTRIRDWGIARSAAAAGAVLVNLHVFPLMAWHTVDGLLVAAGGMSLLGRWARTSSPACFVGAFLLLGAAPLVKQSFALVPVLGLLWVTVKRARERGRQLEEAGDRPRRASRLADALRAAATAGPLAIAPALLYLLWVASAGGLRDAVEQLTASPVATGRSLLTVPDPAFRLHTVLTWVVAPVALAVLHAYRRRGGSVAADFMAPLVLTGLVVYLPVHARLLGRAWAVELFWLVVMVVLAELVVSRRVDGGALLVLAFAWMVALSWGYNVPTLVAGNLGLVVVDRVWRHAPSGEPMLPALPSAIAALVAFGLLASTFLDVRADVVYRDRKKSELSASLGSVDPELRGIRSNPVTTAYLDEIVMCRRRYPAEHFAVLPDNGFVYAVLGKPSPYPVDWMSPFEYQGQSHRLVQANERLRRAGHYLVLFQTVPADGLASLVSLPVARSDSVPFTYGDPVVENLYLSLPGTRIVCGSFVGVHKPGL